MTPTMELWNAGICVRIAFVDGRDFVVFPALHRGGLADEKAPLGLGRPTTQCPRKQGIPGPAIPMASGLPTTR